MAILNQMSPGVIVNEVDLTLIVPNASTNRGAYVGEFNWGPVMQPMLINEESQLLRTFGKPMDTYTDAFVGTSFFSCANFLSYSGNMFVVRVCSSKAKNAGLSPNFVDTISVSNVASKTYTSQYLTIVGGNPTVAANAYMTVTDSNTISITIGTLGSGYTSTPAVYANSTSNNQTLIFTAALSTKNNLLIKNRTQFENVYLLANNANRYGPFCAKFPGELGNSLKISVCSDSSKFMTEAGVPIWDWAHFFDNAPGTSEYAAAKNSANDEMHIMILDYLGRFTGTANTPLEKFSFVSKAFDAVSISGQSNFYKEVLSLTSQYIYALDPIDYANTRNNWEVPCYGIRDYARTENTDIILDGGYDGITVTPAEIILGWDLFKNKDLYDVSLMIIGAGTDKSTAVPRHVLDNVIEGGGLNAPIQGRKDAVCFFSPRYFDVVNQSGYEATNIVNNFLFTMDKSTSYAFVDSGWKYQFDKYNNIYRWVPLNADMAGLCAQTDIYRDPWWSPAGFNRGQVKNVAKLAWNPNQAERDFIYPRGVNPVVSFTGQGPCLFGDRTLYAKPSAFDRINVRRLFIVLEKAISIAAQYFLFEFNDQFTRAQFVSVVEPYLRTIQGRRGIYDFKVVCDETNNTPDIIDRNAFVGDIYIKPARSINFIQLNFVATRTGVEFSSVIGSF